MHILWLPLLVIIIGTASCAVNGPQILSEENSEELQTKMIEPASIKNFDADEFQQVINFQKWASGLLAPEARIALKARCRKDPKSGIFCPEIIDSQFFEGQIAKDAALPPESAATPPVPPTIQWKNGKITNWNTLRKEKISTLVKSLEALSRSEIDLILIANRREKRCPNHWAPALAARLEDFAQSADSVTVAKLYRQGGLCSPRKSPEREQLLSRAALIHFQERRYSEAERILAGLSPQDALSSRPLYWRLRCLLAMGKKIQAEKILAILTSRYPFSFHSLVASHQFKKSYPTRFFSPGAPFPERSQRVRKANRFIEHLELCRKYQQARCGELIAEYTLQRFPRLEAAVRCYVATFADAGTQLKNLQGVVLTRPDLNHRGTFEMLFPRPYLGAFEATEPGAKPDPGLLYAVARKESQLDAKAVSAAEAYGLMQIRIPTARRFKPSADRDLLFDPLQNIAIGARYLEALKTHYNGNLILVLAAYNAGEESVERWTRRYPAADPILFLDLIPYRETRDYVGMVLANFYWYQRLYYQRDSPLAVVMPDLGVTLQNLD